MSSWEIEQFEDHKNRFISVPSDHWRSDGAHEWFNNYWGEFPKELEKVEKAKREQRAKRAEEQRQYQNGALDQDDFFFSYREKEPGEHDNWGRNPCAEVPIRGWMETGFAQLDSRKCLLGKI